MIYTYNNDRFLKYNTPLIDYLKINNGYENENLIYNKRFGSNMLTITSPKLNCPNCTYINGYPYFDVPYEKCVEEINYFLNDFSLYDYNVFIRYGDTHPHKIIPKLAQLRNLYLNQSLSSLIGDNSKSFYGFGDISVKSLGDFCNKYKINISPEQLFADIVNNCLREDIGNKLNEYVLNSLKQLSTYLNKLNLNNNDYIIESSLYKNQDLYKLLKNDTRYIGEHKKNGELKYSLQELMFIVNLLQNKEDVLISILGFNQYEHVIKVNDILKDYNYNCRFLTYEICRNGAERDIDIWSKHILNNISNNFITINGNYIDVSNYLKLLFISNSNDIIIDFANLDKYTKNIKKVTNVLSAIEEPSNDLLFFDKKNDLICLMSLCCYNLNRSVEMGSPIYFLNYVFKIVEEYEKNKNMYKEYSNLYNSFIIKCFEKLGILNKREDEKKYVLSK